MNFITLEVVTMSRDSLELTFVVKGCDMTC